MSRTAYHRAYYYAHLNRRRASARASRRRAREVQAIIKIVCEAVTDARNDKPPVTGVDAAGGLPLRFKCEVSVDEILTDCSSHVNHPSTPTCSGTLVGETTHRVTLNLDRGSQPLGARRQSGSANGNGATREK